MQPVRCTGCQLHRRARQSTAIKESLTALKLTHRAPSSDGREDNFRWSGGLRIQPLLHLCSQNVSKVARQMACASLDSPPLNYRFNLNVIQMAESEGKDLLFELHKFLTSVLCQISYLFKCRTCSISVYLLL